MRIRHSSIAIVALAAALFAAAEPAPAQDSAPAASYKWRRNTSTDPENKNHDFNSLPAGSETTIATLEGPGEIRHIWMTYFEPPAEPDSLRKLVLAIYWDGEKEPSVLCPMGDFFALGNGRKNTVDTAFTSVTPKLSLNSFFSMPFAKSARIAVRNESSVDFPALYHAVEFAAYGEKSAPANTGYFHAQYRQEYPAAPEKHYTVTDIKGRGRYLGTVLSLVLNTNGWWGEGDDVITVDGEASQGTGTEDYFCGSWNFGSTPSQTPRFGAPMMDGLESAGSFWTVYRFHTDLPIPFEKDFKFELEHGFRENDGRPGGSNNYSSVAFYYLDKPQGQAPLPEASARIAKAIIPPITPPEVGVEGEDAYVRGEAFVVSGGLSAMERIEPENRAWHGNTMLQFTGLSPNARFAWRVPISHTAVYLPEIAHLVGPNFSKFDVYVNGSPLALDIEGYAETQAAKNLTLQNVRLPKGVAIFEFVAREKSGPNPERLANIGIDRLKLAPATEGKSYLDAGVFPTAADGAALHELAIAEESVTDRGEPIESSKSPEFIDGYEEGAFALQFPRSLLAMPVGKFDGSISAMEIVLWVNPDEVGKREMLLEHRDRFWLSLEKGAVDFGIVDADGVAKKSRTPEGLIPAETWTRIRIAVKPSSIRIFVNEALVQETPVGWMRRLATPEGRTVLGAGTDGEFPYRGAIGGLSIRARKPSLAAGERN